MKNSGKRNTGPLSDIARILIRPILRNRPENVSIHSWLYQNFHVDTRKITRFECANAFTMPGTLVQGGATSTQGIGPRHVREGAELIVRVDETMPDFVDVETPIGPGRRWLWFKVDSIDFERMVKPNIYRDRRRTW